MIAFADSALLGMPVDPVVAAYVYRDRHNFLIYVILASLGSALGSIPLYLIGYYGGEPIIEKRLSRERFQRIHASFEKHEFWALMFPAMLPPPFPFKAFVLGAAVFRMHYVHFITAIFAGRFVRFLTLSLLTLYFGPQIVEITGQLFHQHLGWVAGGIAGLVFLWFLFHRRRNRNRESANS